MKLFMLNILGFGAFLGIISTIVLIYLPDYGRQNNVLHILKEKYQTVEAMSSPKLLFIGGSNLAYGLNTEAVSKEIGLPAYNMGVHAGLGLRFMLASLEPHVKKGDVVVVTPEYSQFSSTFNGADELLTVLTDVCPAQKKHLSYGQMGHLLGQLPKIVGRKVFHGILKLALPAKYKDDQHISPYYHKNTFNKYGDATEHWTAKSVALEGVPLKGDLDEDALAALIAFKTKVEAKGGKVLLSYPCFQAASFDKSLEYIQQLEKALGKTAIQQINTPKRYRMPDDFCFDTFYHLTKEGVDFRTQLFIEDLKKVL